MLKWMVEGMYRCQNTRLMQPDLPARRPRANGDISKVMQEDMALWQTTYITQGERVKGRDA
jgi:hypothetical protein